VHCCLVARVVWMVTIGIFFSPLDEYEFDCFKSTRPIITFSISQLAICIFHHCMKKMQKRAKAVPKVNRDN